ncbi:uncharacterized protein PFL1_04658 [Pseudozyma flocculosa PF-1]|uniref:Related to PRM10 - Pheromone-regulated protein, proposed to be involved in mating n=2 Tax=Pseudozyma flocculosa TaxID=84751 RepID=A0A5C3FBD4_9BASI|nr:uncharacterized protein PFL1_04658 [Pseudozyma flocculosa PF-1]EPQ27914.1 hypothetical protein PFL1_04658 [Pseudozyma flocculosa PF-1]SPO41698.1 related to PRM10 - Pheromone-regulated protein, proposed to be involved in mating [Pseudozyma flocculosa]
MTDSQDSTLNNSSSEENPPLNPPARDPQAPSTNTTTSALVQEGAVSASSANGSRGASRAGRVHFDGSSDASSWRRDQLQLSQAGGGGPTVTARGGARPEGGLSLGSVHRPNHPGPLNLAERLTPLGEKGMPDLSRAKADDTSPMALPPAVAAGPVTAPAPVEVPTLSLTGAKGLDEQGLDNRAFLELQRELQRHEAKSDDGQNGSPTSWPGVRANSGATAPDAARQGAQRHALEQALMEREREREARRQRQAAAFAPDTPGVVSASVSGASTPGGATSESSYDPANDSDLDHIDLVPGETDGMPARIRKKKDEEPAEEQPRGWAKLRSIFGKPADDDELDEKEKGGSGPVPHEEGGPTNWKSVPVQTSSGLHTQDGPRRKPSKFEREAARLVKQHKLAQTRASTLSRINRSHLPDSGDTTPDPMETSMQMDARPIAAGGVLGNLLRLYEQQQREQMEASGRSAATSSVGSESELLMDIPAGGSEAGGAAEAAKEDRVPEAGRNVNAYPSASPLGRTSFSAAPSPGGGSRPTNRRGWSHSGMPSPGIGQTFAQVGGKVGSKVINTSSKVVKGVANEAGFEDVMDERPKAARSGAGVFGALVATTGNLIGAVSPAHAQLGPNPKRPGYTLDRYLLPEMNAKTLKRTAQIVADAGPRPHRTSGFSSPNETRSHSVPGSPPMNGFGGERIESGSTQPGTPPTGTTGANTPKKRPASIMMFPSRSKTSTDANGNTPHHHRRLHLPVPGALTKSWTGHSTVNTPDVYGGPHGDYFGVDNEKLARQEWQRKLKKRAKDKRRKEEIFITMHVAAILQRQEFLLKLSRALMMFGAPTHRIETQIQQTARVLEVNCRCIYLPNLMLLAFGDDTTHTSETKFIKQGGGLDLTKLTDMHSIYWNVIHDKIGVGEASAQLDELMRRKPLIGRWPMVLIGGFASFFICLGTAGFGGSFIDALAAFPLGMFLVYCQSIITTELYSNVFEIVFATLNSFIAAALQYSGIFCYSAVVSGSIVLILPGFIVLSGSLELQAKNLIAGSVRMVYAIIYSLFLGFGLSIGVSIWDLFRGVSDGSQPYDICRHPTDKGWWRKDVPEIFALLTTPGYSIALSLRNQVKVNRKEFPVMVLIACAGWASNHFSAKSPALSGRQDITAALGSLVVGLAANIYGRVFDGRSFVVAVPGILYQLPSGLSNTNGGGILGFANTDNTTTSYSTSGFGVASSLVETALGLTVGLFTSTVISYLFGGRKVRNGGGLFSF